MAAFIGEIIGTMIIISFGGGVVAGVVLKKLKAENSGWIDIIVDWAFVGVLLYQVIFALKIK